MKLSQPSLYRCAEVRDKGQLPSSSISWQANTSEFLGAVLAAHMCCLYQPPPGTAGAPSAHRHCFPFSKKNLSIWVGARKGFQRQENNRISRADFVQSPNLTNNVVSSLWWKRIFVLAALLNCLESSKIMFVDSDSMFV